MENRSAVFTSQPQVVEVFQAGTWWSGELLGWRHDESGACQMWVRAVIGGVEQSAWVDLTALRLPEPLVAPPAPPIPPRVEEPRRLDPTARHRRADAETTASLPLARDHLGDPTRARSGGRRRAPETAEQWVVAAAPVPVPTPGRHRAPSPDPDAGRHRAADTGMFPAVVEQPVLASGRRRAEFPAAAAWSVPAARPVPLEETVADAARGGAVDELLTRPMRLTDSVPHSRRPRLMAH